MSISPASAVPRTSPPAPRVSPPVPARASVLSARGVHKSYPAHGAGGAPGRHGRRDRVEVLRGVDLDVAAGEMVSIVGPSGSGKSTLLFCLAGLEPVDTGEIRLGADRVHSASPGQLARLRRDRVGFVFQSYNLIPSLSVRENVALPARLARRARPDVEGALGAVGLTGHGGKRPGALSGGEQQRVAIARVLAAAPPLVFADEPTGALDTVTGGRVLDLLRGYACGERSVVLVTHDLDAAARADRTIVLRDGAVVAELRRPAPADILAVLHGGVDSYRTADGPGSLPASASAPVEGASPHSRNSLHGVPLGRARRSGLSAAPPAPASGPGAGDGRGGAA